MGGSGGTTSKTGTQIPTELQPLYKQTGTAAQGYQAATPLLPFNAPHPLNVAPLSGRESQAFGMIPGITAKPAAESQAYTDINALPGIAGQRPSDYNTADTAGNYIPSLLELSRRRADLSNIDESPIVKAGLENYRLNTEPSLVNQMTLSGLGRSSSLGNAMARGRASLLQPLYQNEIDAQNQAIDRQLGTAERGLSTYLGTQESELGRSERAIGRQAEAVQAGVPELMGLGQTERNAYLQELQKTQEAGATERGIAQDTNQANQADFLRRQALAEQSLFGILGQFLPSTLGQKTTSGTTK